MFFHMFHVPVISANWEQLFGVSVSRTFEEMDAENLSRLDVARRYRGPDAPVGDEIRAIFQSVAAQGVRRREMPVAQRPNILDVQLSNVDRWLSWKRPTAKMRTQAGPGKPFVCSFG
jgi:hypothetical protein